jgi:hypothetical protein
MGTTVCSEYVPLDLYFYSQLGIIWLKGVEAYIVKDMQANLLIGEDTQRAWQLHTIRNVNNSHWKVRDSPHRILAVLGPSPTETFTVEWEPQLPNPRAGRTTAPAKEEWKVLATTDVLLPPEACCLVEAEIQGTPAGEDFYVDRLIVNGSVDPFSRRKM